MGADDVAAAFPEPPRRRGRVRSWLLPLLGLMPFGAGLALWLRTFPSTIDSTAQLTRVEFGWPLVWTTQDLTRYAPQHYPASMDYIGGKYVVDVPPTAENWWLFAVNAVILGVCAFLVFVLVVRLLRPVLLGRVGGADPGAARPDPGRTDQT